jgi:hypothetical protein
MMVNILTIFILFKLDKTQFQRPGKVLIGMG